MVRHKQREEEGVGKGEEAYEGEKSEGEREADGEKKLRKRDPRGEAFLVSFCTSEGFGEFGVARW